MRQKSNTVALFEPVLASERVTGTSSAVEAVRSDEGKEFKPLQNFVGGTTSVRSLLSLIV